MKADKFFINLHHESWQAFFVLKASDAEGWVRQLKHNRKWIRQMNQGFPTLARFMQILNECVSSSYCEKSTF